VSVRARIMILALLLIGPPMIDRVRLLENTRADRIARAGEEVADLAQRGAEAQSEIINSARALLQVVGRAYGTLATSSENCAALLSGFAADCRGSAGFPWWGRTTGFRARPAPPRSGSTCPTATMSAKRANPATSCSATISSNAPTISPS
jgi:hypothetical protein